MIARTWRGVTRAEDRDAYVRYLRRTGLTAYASAEGNRGALVLCRSNENRTEFLLLSLWDSHDAVRAFAGDEPERAVFFPEDDDFLVEKDLVVDHYQVVDGGEPPDDSLRPGEDDVRSRAEDRHARGWRIVGLR